MMGDPTRLPRSSGFVGELVLLCQGHLFLYLIQLRHLLAVVQITDDLHVDMNTGLARSFVPYLRITGKNLGYILRDVSSSE